MNYVIVLPLLKFSIIYLHFIGILRNLHIALIMDCSNSEFTVHCESNPALYKQCTVLWMESWSKETMHQVNIYVLTKDENHHLMTHS